MADQLSYWVPDLMPKQMLCFNSWSRYLLLEGCKMSGKTRAALHKVARHLWETDRAEVGVFVRLTKSAKNSGIWEELCVTVIEEWMRNSYFYGKWVKPGPNTTDGITKVAYFQVRNMHGTISKCSLYNSEDDTDAEKRIKGTRFSMVYIPEATNFSSRAIFDATKVQLRMLHLKYEEHQILLDCNPAEEGENSWLYKLFMVEKYLPIENEGQKAFRDQLESIHFEIADNTRIDPREFLDLKASYEYSPDLYARYIEGKWTASSENSHFADLFIENIHVVGQAHGPNKDTWEVITPDDTCHELYSGFDIGSVNHAAVIALKRIVNNQTTVDVIDELVFLKDRVGIDEFTELFLEKMDIWENFLRLTYDIKQVHWHHWSDDSAFIQYRSAADSYDQILVRNASEGRIMLNAAPKAKGSVRMRVEMMRKLLFQKRIFFSAQLFETLRMIKGLKKGRTIATYIDPIAPEKHVFDALTYLLIGELPLDAQNRTRPKVERRSSVVAVGL